MFILQVYFPATTFFRCYFWIDFGVSSSQVTGFFVQGSDRLLEDHLSNGEQERTKDALEDTPQFQKILLVALKAGCLLT